MDKTQYLVRTSRNEDFARVEPYQGGKKKAIEGAKSIGGYVIELDEYLCKTDKIVADFRQP